MDARATARGYEHPDATVAFSAGGNHFTKQMVHLPAVFTIWQIPLYWIVFS